MTIALTGASGYVGSIIAASLPPGSLVRLDRRPARAEDIAWSLEDQGTALVDRLRCNETTDLIHAAWDMRQSSKEAVERICVEGSRALLQAARAAGVHRVIFISTISAFDEARSVYGRAKRQVEYAVLDEGGIVLRLGLVHGGNESGAAAEGGMFGTLRRSVRQSAIVPMIGGGRVGQYCLDAARLRTAIRRCLAGDLDGLGKPLTLADETPVALRDLVRRIAAEESRRPILVPVPWRPVYATLRALEGLGLEPPLRSDSVLGLVYANAAPDFSETRRLGL